MLWLRFVTVICNFFFITWVCLWRGVLVCVFACMDVCANVLTIGIVHGMTG